MNKHTEHITIIPKLHYCSTYFLQKPTVFTAAPNPYANDSSKANGFGAELVRIAEKYLNFSSVFVRTDDFGFQFVNGTWGGIVGVLHRKVSRILD